MVKALAGISLALDRVLLGPFQYEHHHTDQEQVQPDQDENIGCDFGPATSPLTHFNERLDEVVGGKDLPNPFRNLREKVD